MTINEDGTPVLIEAVYYRYHRVHIEEFDTIEQATGFLEYGEDDGFLSSVGVFVDGEPHSWRYVDDSQITDDWMRDEYRKAKADA